MVVLRMLPVLLFAILSFNLSGCASVIQPGQRAVKISLGKVDGHLIKPGFIWFNPLVDDLEVYSVKEETVGTESNPLTKDQQPIKLDYKVRYAIPEGQVLNLYQEVKGDIYPTLVEPQVQEAFRQVVSRYNADEVIGGVNKIKNEVIVEVVKNVKGRITIIDIPITHIELPEALQASILEKQKVEIEAKKKTFELQREKQQAEITVTKAIAEAKAIREQAEALKNSKELVEYRRLEVEKIKASKWNGQLPGTVVQGQQGGTLFNLR